MADLNIKQLRNPALRDFFQDVFDGTTALEGVSVQADGTSIPVAFTTSAPVNAVASQGTLTMDTQPTAGDTMTIGTTVYTFMADGTADEEGEIDVGADLADAKTLVIAAINGTDGNNTAHALVSAGTWTGDDLPLTAKTKGTAGDAIATTENFTAGTNVFDATTLGTTTAGVDGTVGAKGQAYVDSSYLYFAVAANTIADANWRRITLGSAY
jgi:hypothetical protein